MLYITRIEQKWQVFLFNYLCNCIFFHSLRIVLHTLDKFCSNLTDIREFMKVKHDWLNLRNLQKWGDIWLSIIFLTYSLGTSNVTMNCGGFWCFAPAMFLMTPYITWINLLYICTRSIITLIELKRKWLYELKCIQTK